MDLTNEELMAIAGPPSGGDLSSLSNEELMGIAGPPRDDSFMGGLWQGIKDTPSNLYGLGKGVFNTIAHPIDTAKKLYNDPVSALNLAGNMSSGALGAVGGATAGAPLAPFTFGLSVPIGAAIGGGLGMLGFQEGKELVGAEEDTTLSQKLPQLGRNIGAGIGIAGAVKGAGLAAKGAGAALKTVGDASKRLSQSYLEDAFGVKPGDLAKSTAKTGQFVDDVGNPVSNIDDAVGMTNKIQKDLNILKEDGFTAKAPNNPELLRVDLAQKVTELAKNQAKLIDGLDTQLKLSGQSAKFKPIWKYAEDYIESGKGTAGNKAALRAELNRIKQDWEASPGTFRALNDFKQQITADNTFTTSATEAASTKLRQAIYKGVKESAEQNFDGYAKAVDPSLLGKLNEVNKQLSAYKTFEKTLNNRMARDGALPLLKSLGDLKTAVTLGASAVGGAPVAVPATAGMFARALGKARPASAARFYEGTGNKFTNTGDFYGMAGDALSQLGQNPLAIAASQLSDVEGQRLAAPDSLSTSQSQETERLEPPSTKKGIPDSQSSSNYTLNPPEIQLDNIFSALMKGPDLATKINSKFGEIDLGTVMKAIRRVESSDGKHTTGPATKYGTAKGDYQLLDSTGKEYHKKLGITEPYDPYNREQAEAIASAVLLDYLRMFDGDLEKAVTAYHSGPGNVQKGKLGPQGRAYAPKVEAVLEKLLKA